VGQIAPGDAKTPDLRCARKGRVQLPGSGATPSRYPAATPASMGRRAASSKRQADTEGFISRVASLLDLGAVGLPELRQMAIDEGKGRLAAQLASLG